MNCRILARRLVIDGEPPQKMAVVTFASDGLTVESIEPFRAEIHSTIYVDTLNLERVGSRLRKK